MLKLKYTVQRQPMSSRKCFQNGCTVEINGRNQTESFLFGIIVVLIITVFLYQLVVHGEGFRSKYKPYFNWEMAKQFTCTSEGIIGLFFIVYLWPIVALQLSTVKLPYKTPWFSSDIHFELEIKRGFKFPAFLELTNSDVTSFLSDNYPTIFPTALRLWRPKKK